MNKILLPALVLMTIATMISSVGRQVYLTNWLLGACMDGAGLGMAWLTGVWYGRKTCA